MQRGKQWTCEGCGHTQVLRKIDRHRWIRVGPSDQTAGNARLSELCPGCQVRLKCREDPQFRDAAQWQVPTSLLSTKKSESLD